YSEVGHGTTFKIYLPAVADVADGKHRTSAVVPARGTETVLLVEDVEELRYLTKRMLESAGYMVLGAASGEQAVRVLDGYSEPVHLMITDVVMPGIGGGKLAELL